MSERDRYDFEQQRALLLKSVDDHLRPGATRFFGSGHRRVDYAVGDTRLHGAADGLASTVEIRYPSDRSRKTEHTPLRPHLSTIDVLILAVRAAELLTAQRNGLDLAARGRTWLCRVDIKAPAKPVEGNVFSLPVAATRASTEAADGGRFRSTVAVKVADMRVRVLLEHDAGGLAGSSSDLDTRFGADYPGLYGGGFRSWRQTVADVVVDVTAASSTTNVLVEPPNDPFADAGVDSAAGPVVSMVDSLVVALQLDEVEIAALFIALATLRASPSTATRTRARQPWARPARYLHRRRGGGVGRSPW